MHESSAIVLTGGPDRGIHNAVAVEVADGYGEAEVVVILGSVREIFEALLPILVAVGGELGSANQGQC